LLNDAVNKTTDAQRRMTMNLLTEDMWQESAITSCGYDGILKIKILFTNECTLY
jgi:hypothetical protein